MDIRADNFINYRLVDFGSSWTELHLLKDLEDTKPRAAKAKKSKDRANLEDMI